MSAPVVIVGASMAGLRAAEQLRANGWDGAVTVVGEELHEPYNRPPLSKELLAGSREAAVHEMHAKVAFRKRASVADVTWRLGTRVESADLESRTVSLSTGEKLEWSGLVVATGLRPRRLPLPGPARGRAALRTLDDAHRLGGLLSPEARVVVIGAGFIGCEVAATAHGLGCEVTVVEPLVAPLIRGVGEDVGRTVQAYHESKGVRFSCGRSVVQVLPSSADPDSVGGVRLDDGTEVAADVVVEAVGSVPNVEWLDGNDLDLSDGVVCDRWMRVEGRPDVVAAGDVARFPNERFHPGPRRVEHWCTPTDTAKQAGATLAGHLRGEPVTTAFGPLPSFWSDQFELRLQSFGVTTGADAIEVVSGELDRLTEGVVVHYSAGGRLVGVLLINVPASQHRAQRDLVAAANPVPPAQSAHPVREEVSA